MIHILWNNKNSFIECQNNKVIIKVKGTGLNKVFDSGLSVYPKRILINGVEQNSISTSYEFEDSQNGYNKVELIWDNIVSNCCNMFRGCSNIIEIDFSNFDSSEVNHMNSMFKDCTSLTSLDLSNFDISNVWCIEYIFSGCSKLEYINIEKFSNNRIESGHYTDMFYGIPKNAVVCLNGNEENILGKLSDQNCKTIGCSKNWQLIQKKNIDDQCYEHCYLTDNYKYDYNGKCLGACVKGQYNDGINPSIIRCKCELDKCKSCPPEALKLNLCETCNTDFYPKEDDSTNNNGYFDCYKQIDGYYLDTTNSIFKKCYETCSKCEIEGDSNNHNCIICKSNYNYEQNMGSYINCYDSCAYYKYYDKSNGKRYCTNGNYCPNDYNKLILEKGMCVSDCSEDDYYRYEFRNKCYHECPIDISEQSTKNFFCEAKCPKELPYEVISSQECVEKCSVIDIGNEICKINYISNDENDKEVEDKAIENIQEELTDNFDTSSIDNGTNIVIKQKDSTITITTTDNQKNENSNNATTINLGECENKIKAAYNIPSDKPLYILKIEVKQNGLKIPKTEYEVYYPLFGESLIKLNLTACENLKIDLSIPVKLSDDIKKMNSSSEYYNDICYTYTSEDGTDMSLSDRQKQFVNNNLTLCEENCDFTDYDYSLEKAVCSCKVKTNSTFKIGDVVIDTNKLYDSFTNIKNIANLNVLKCYKLMFKLEAYKSNYANLILIFIIFLFLLSLIIFFCKDYFDLLRILHMIVFFKLNPKLVKKFLERLKKEQNKRTKKIIKNNININILAPKKISFDKTNYFVINGVVIKRPIFSKDYNKMERELIKNNPVKKKLKIKKNMIESTSKILNILQTSNLQKKYIRDKQSEKDRLNENEMYKIFLKINNFTYTELNQLKYLEAIKLDKRTYLQYYISLVCTNHILVFSFISKFDYNSKILKQFLFFFNFTVNFTVNALFFNDETMHKIYTDKGSFNFIYNIPQILYSSLITGFIIALIQTLALTDSYLINLKHYKDKRSVINKEKEVKKILIIKFVLFFFVCLILLIIFWFYLACFCSVYKNTQLHLIKDTLISFGTSMIYPLFIYLVPGIFRIIAINSKKRNKECMFKFSKLLQLL